MSAPHSTPWLVHFRPNQAAKLQLFCFPPAGGGASMFYRWKNSLPDHIAIHAVQYPGHETRIREALATHMRSLAGEIASTIGAHIGTTPYAFFGHSLGALAAYETALALQRAGRPTPCAAVFSGRRAPGQPPPDRPLHQLEDSELLTVLREMSGTPEVILNNREMMDLLLPVIRADLALGENYRWDGTVLDGVPAAVFLGREDRVVPPDSVSGWQHATSGPVTTHLLNGGHFYFQDQAGAFFAALIEVLSPCG